MPRWNHWSSSIRRVHLLFQAFYWGFLKIRKGAFPDSRYVEIQSTAFLKEDGEYDDNFETRWPLCIEQAPAVFFICQETRAEVVKFYKPFRGTEEGSEVVLCDFSQGYWCFTYPRCVFCRREIHENIPDMIWNWINRIAIIFQGRFRLRTQI